MLPGKVERSNNGTQLLTPGKQYPPVYGEEIDKDWVSSLRIKGCIIRCKTLAMLLRVLLEKYDKSFLLDQFKYDQFWANKWSRKHNFSYRVGTTAKCENTELKDKFLSQVALLVAKYRIPKALVVNADQTGV